MTVHDHTGVDAATRSLVEATEALTGAPDIMAARRAVLAATGVLQVELRHHAVTFHALQTDVSNWPTLQEQADQHAAWHRQMARFDAQHLTAR